MSGDLIPSVGVSSGGSDAGLQPYISPALPNDVNMVHLPPLSNNQSFPVNAAAVTTLNHSGSPVAAPNVPPSEFSPHDVSWQEYQRVCHNERTLTENVATLKSLVLQLATQLNDAQATIEVLQRSSVSRLPPGVNSADNLTSFSAAGSEQGTPSALRKQLQEAAKTRAELVAALERKSCIIQTLQQRLAEQDKQWTSLLDEVAREKDVVIERLTLQIDKATPQNL